VTLPSLIVGNWKMNGRRADLGEIRVMADDLLARPRPVRLGLCPPFTLLAAAKEIIGAAPIRLGAQDCAAEPCGARTGDIAAEMLADAGAAMVILGHSERRAFHGETSAQVAAKAEAAIMAGLEPILCVGETLKEREAGAAVEVVTRQVEASAPLALSGRSFAIAYEPVWAIGSGLTPTLVEIGEVHAAIRRALRARFGDSGEGPPILYGGSVKPGNAAEILALEAVGGALVGGASLRARDFLGIVDAA
jgi:triosephosphate isomerase